MSITPNNTPDPEIKKRNIAPVPAGAKGGIVGFLKKLKENPSKASDMFMGTALGLLSAMSAYNILDSDRPTELGILQLLAGTAIGVGQFTEPQKAKILKAALYATTFGLVVANSIGPMANFDMTDMAAISASVPLAFEQLASSGSNLSLISRNVDKTFLNQDGTSGSAMRNTFEKISTGAKVFGTTATLGAGVTYLTQRNGLGLTFASLGLAYLLDLSGDKMPEQVKRGIAKSALVGAGAGIAALGVDFAGGTLGLLGAVGFTSLNALTTSLGIEHLMKNK